MKRLFLLLVIAIVLVGCEEKYEFGYIDSLKGTVWQYYVSNNKNYTHTLDFKSNGTVIYIIDNNGDVLDYSKNGTMTWSCSSDGTLNFYYDQFIGSGPYMTGTFDKYKGSLTVDGNKYKLIHQD